MPAYVAGRPGYTPPHSKSTPGEAPKLKFPPQSPPKTSLPAAKGSSSLKKVFEAPREQVLRCDYQCGWFWEVRGGFGARLETAARAFVAMSSTVLYFEKVLTDQTVDITRVVELSNCLPMESRCVRVNAVRWSPDT